MSDGTYTEDWRRFCHHRRKTPFTRLMNPWLTCHRVPTEFGGRMTETKTKAAFSEVMFKYHRYLSDFEESLSDAGFEDFEKLGGDWYDNSLEIMGVQNDARLNEAAQKIIFDAGFSKVYVNHKDGWETHYTWGSEFAPQRGWRRRYVSDPTVPTTNVIVGRSNNGYYEMNYWPENWGNMETNDGIKSGYYRVVGD